MRKITGKALATVLAMALITSSFSGTFAFAATKTEKAGGASFSDDGKDEITLVKDTTKPNEYNFDLYGMIGGMTLDTVDKEYIGASVNEDDISYRHAKGDSLLSIKDGMARIKTDKTGTETIMVYGETVISRDDKDVTLKGQKEITIHVVESGTLFVAFDGGKTLEGSKGDEVPALEVSRNAQMTDEDVKIYKAVSARDAKRAELKADPVNADKTDAEIEKLLKAEDDLEATYVALGEKAGAAGTFVDGSDEYHIEAPSNGRFTVDNTNAVTKMKNADKGTGTMKLTIKDAKNKTADTTTATVLKRIDLTAPETGSVTIEKDGSQTTVSPVSAAAGYDKNISGYDINATAGVSLVIDESVSLGEIKNADSVTVSEKAKVGNIKDSKTVTVDGGTVGEIDVSGNVSMNDGRVASIKTTGATIEINGGTVSGDVIADNENTTVEIDAEDDDINTVISGKVQGKDITIGASSEDANVQIGSVVLDTDGELKLSDKNITIDKLDCAYKGSVVFNAFEGKIKSVLNAADVTVDEDSVVVIEDPVEIDSLDISDGGSIEFRDTVKISSISGDGKLIVAAEKLTVTDSISGEVKLRLAGANVNVGDVAFKAAKDAADADSFVGVGFKMEKKSVDKNTDSFLVKSVSFAGLALDKSEVTIAKGFSNTVTVSNYPASTSLPTGASVVWDFSDADKDIFDITADGATLNIAVKDYDDVYATSNSFDLYATVVDADGDALEDYDSAKCTVNAIAEVPVSSDLTGIVEVPQGSTKDFVVNSSVEAPVTIGTGDVAVHAVKTPFANAQATYTIKATGAVGTTAGVYATVPGQNATKLFIIKVTAPVVTSDTTVDFDLTAGSRYVFKITAPAAPSFTVGNGAVLKTQAGKIDGNDYYFAVYAQNVAGQSTGVYVNGVKVCTVTVK